MSTDGRPNILLIIADDLGEDVVVNTVVDGKRSLAVSTNNGAVLGPLPNLGLLKRNGLRFSQAWSQPACSPTRASIFTGLHSWRHGIGSPNRHDLRATDTLKTLPQMLPDEYVCGLFGKWHLGDERGTRPTDHGWDRYQGALGGAFNEGGSTNSYDSWPRVDSATGYLEGDLEEMHATWVTVRDAGTWIEEIVALDASTPWFVTVAFNAPHSPFHLPTLPTEWGGASWGYDDDVPTVINQNRNPFMFNAMTQNLDANVGRLLGSVSGGIAGQLDIPAIDEGQLENTIIIFVGDNGSPEAVAPREAKTEIYEGGIKVPMIIADGQAVGQELASETVAPRYLSADKIDRSSNQPVHLVDLCATIATIADESGEGLPDDLDSVDLGPLFTEPSSQPLIRQFNFAQYFSGDTKRATIRDLDYKLNFIDDGETSSYSLFRYEGTRIPGSEIPGNGPDDPEGNAPDLLEEAASGDDPDAAVHLHSLVTELMANYRLDDADERFPLPAVLLPRPPEI